MNTPLHTLCPPQLSRRRHGRAAFTIVEAAVCVVIVGVMLVAALQTVGSAADGRRRAYQLRTSQALADQLLAEIMSMPYVDPNAVDPTDFGAESGETSVPRNFNDTDDYDGLSESPPRDRTGAVIPGYEDWRWTATITIVDSGLSGVSRTQGDKGTRLVTVSVINPAGDTSTISAIRSRWSIADQPPKDGVPDLSAIRVSVSAGDGAQSVSAGASFANVPESP